MAIAGLSSSSAAGPTSVQGLSSGINWQDLVDAMIQADRASTALMEKRKATFQARLDATRAYNTKVLAVQLDLSTLSKASTFNARTATTSNSAALAASTTSNALPGTTTFDVVSVAKAHSIATLGQASSTANLGAGTVQIQLGAGSPLTVTIDDASSSLQGIASAINAANLGVSASVVNDGTANPYRLVLTSSQTGTANALTVSGTGALAGLFAGSTELQAAKDAQLRLGSGAGAILLTQATNTFTDVLPGVTLTAKQEATGVTVTVGTDSTNAIDAVKSFIESYNGAVQHLTDNASYDTTKKAAGVLFSESDLRSRFGSLTQALLQSVSLLPSSLSTLSSVGIDLDYKTGHLSLDEDVLAAKLAADPDGVSRIFANSGTSTAPGVSFSTMSEKTKTGAPFQVSITTAASQAQVTGTAPLADGTVITGSNDLLMLQVNGTIYSTNLAQRTFATKQELATHIQAVLDQKISKTTDKVKVVLDSGGQLVFTGAVYGSKGTLAVLDANANATLGLTTASSTGVDVVGTINGQAATGIGQSLSGLEGTDAEGLRLTITATAPVALATISVSKGLAQAALEKANSMTDSTTGALPMKEDTLQKQIDDLTESIAANDARLEIRRDRLLRKFQQMETLIQQMQAQGNYLTNQIKGFENSAAAAAKG